MASPRPELALHDAANASEWEAWLEANHATSPGVWLKIAKKGSGRSSASYAEALEVAICFGWIDGQKRALDESFWLQRFTPRGRRSRWSQVNREKAQALIDAAPDASRRPGRGAGRAGRRPLGSGL